MFYVNLNAAPFLAAFSNHYRAPRPSQPSRTSCSGRRATQSGCACSALDLNRVAHNKKAVADARLYGGIETAQVTAAKCSLRSGDAAGRPRTGPQSRAKFTRQARRPAKFAARAMHQTPSPTFKLPRVRERRIK